MSAQGELIVIPAKFKVSRFPSTETNVSLPVSLLKRK
jgi:hypothetical protein